MDGIDVPEGFEWNPSIPVFKTEPVTFELHKDPAVEFSDEFHEATLVIVDSGRNEVEPVIMFGRDYAVERAEAEYFLPMLETQSP